jgi:PAS domain S-box-containing protein
MQNAQLTQLQAELAQVRAERDWLAAQLARKVGGGPPPTSPQPSSLDSASIYRLLTRLYPETAVFLFDRDFRCLMLEGDGIAATQLTREGVEGRLLDEIFVPQTAAKFAGVLWRAFQGGRLQFEYMTRLQSHVFDVHVIPIYDGETDDVSLVMMVARDITAQRFAAQMLRESETRFFPTVRHSATAIARIAPGGALIFVNQAFVRCFGLPPEMLIGLVLASLPGHPSAFRRLWDAARGLSAHAPVHTSEIRLDLGGKTAWTRWVIRALYENDHLREFQLVGREVASPQVSPAMAANTMSASNLTRRERLVLSGIVEGLTNLEIAHKLDVKLSTVKTYVSRIFFKLEATSRVEAATLALRHRLLE